MRIVSWNVNSIKARLDHVTRFLQESAPDVLMVQELKGLDFPAAHFKDQGYESAHVAQKAYNGVAVLSRAPITVIHTALAGDEGDEGDDQARFIEVEVDGLRLINIYAPNGNPVDSEKFTYKCAWMARLHRHVSILRENRTPFAMGGDFNIIPEDRDCHDPKAWEGDALFRPESRGAFQALLNLGLYDAFRIYDDAHDQYTFWDYQAGAWPRNNGIRIDHFLLSPEMADRLQSCTIDKAPRGWDTPSDHTPIMIEIFR